ncbi:hypothetical protein [Runella salmonicolor]|uniref:Uncharacterized protein n=1 Tax=Runella salmonicolor TaxID=2950278 RepID=A0ABT1FVV2_9BACT|nr:hypothetical protein [Runella salmonicolor]MCP1384798.1 hypothetical protein [Runella salmonicolor]
MGQKLGAFFKKQLEKAGAFNAEKHNSIIEKLNDLTEDLDDSENKTLSETFVTLAEAKEHPGLKKAFKDSLRGELKSEFLDPVDSELKPYEALLDEKNKDEYTKADTTYKKLKVLTKFLSERAGGDGKDAKAYRDELTALQAQIKSGDFVSKSQYDQVFGKVNSALQAKTLADVFASSVPKMSKQKLQDPYVKDDFGSRVEKLMKKRGWVFDHESGELRKESAPEEIVLLEGSTEKMTIEHLPDIFYKEFEDWGAKSDGGGKDDLEVERKGPNTSKDSTLEKNRQRAAGL